MSNPALDSTVSNCGLGCVSVGDADDRALCVTECLLKETKLSCSCGACYGWHFGSHSPGAEQASLTRPGAQIQMSALR